MAAGIYHWSFLFSFFAPSFDTCLLIKSMACALSCSALCKSARMRVSATFSTERLVHKASSHMTFKRLRAYWGGRGNTKQLWLHPRCAQLLVLRDVVN